MQRNRQRQLHIFLWMIGVLTLGCIIYSYVGGTGQIRLPKSASGSFDDAWVVEDTVNGDSIVHVPQTLERRAGEAVVLKNRIPDSLADNTVLLVETTFQHFELMIGETPIYTCNQNSNHTLGEEPFPGYYMIPISTGYAGFDIRLIVNSDYHAYAGKIGSLILGGRGEVILRLMKQHLAGLLGGVLLVVLAVVLWLLKAAMGSFAKRKYEFTYVMLLLFLSGAYMLFSNGMLRLLCEGTQGLYISSLLVFMLLPFFYVMYLYTIIDKRRVIRFVNYAMIVLILNYVVAVVLVLLNVVDVVVYGTIATGVEMFVLAALTFILSAAAMKYKQMDLTYHAISNIVFFIFLVLYMVFGMVETLAVYKDICLIAGILVWCFLMLYYTEGRIADTMQGELVLAKNSLTESKQQTLYDLKPDTLFGGLHTLLDMMKKKDPGSGKYLVSFSDYLRGRLNMLRYDPSMLISFEEELAHITGCLELAMRKNENFEYQTEIKVTDFKVPAFAVEAFVENAVLYGTGTKDAPTLISIKTYETEKDYAIQIADTGSGFLVDGAGSRGEYGIIKSTERLQNMADAFVDIRSKKGKGTVVTVKLPKYL